MKLAPLFVCLTLATPIGAQNPRPTILIGPTSPDPADDPVVASSGDLTIAAYRNTSSGQVFVTSSDDRGLEFSPPVRIDDDFTGAAKRLEEWSVQISGDLVLVAWEDERSAGADEVRFVVSQDRGATWGPNLRVDVGVPAGSGFVRDWRVDLTEGVLGTNVYFFVNQEPAAGGTEEAFLVANDPSVSVETMLPAVRVPTWLPQAFDVDTLGLAAEGDRVVVAWDDNRNGADDTYVRVSNDRGQTLGPELRLDVDPTLPASDTEGDTIDVAMLGSTVAVAWHQENNGSGPESLRVAISVDGGASFAPDLQVGQYLSGIHDVDRQRIAVDPTDSTRLFVAWIDDRSGEDGVYFSRSTDSGVTWSPDTILTSDGNSPRLVVGADGVLGVGFGRDNGAGEDAAIAYSIDSGANWTTLVTDDTDFDVDGVAIAYADSLQNFVTVFLSDDSTVNEVSAGGYSVCGPATVVSRDAGSNPTVYSASPAVLGGSFSATVDTSVTGHALTALVGYTSPLTFPLGGGQVLLVNVADPVGELFGFPAQPGPLAVYSTLVPNDPGTCGLVVYTQALLVGGVTPFALTNAQDFTLGAF